MKRFQKTPAKVLTFYLGCISNTMVYHPLNGDLNLYRYIAGVLKNNSFGAQLPMSRQRELFHRLTFFIVML